MASFGLKSLCTPAYFYLVISIIALLIMYLQNVGNIDIYCMGSYNCGVTSTFFIFFIKIVYILFWTWLLNIICQYGYTNVSWFLVLFPFILMFLLIGVLFLTSPSVM
jgi:hypothetical protein